MSTWQLDPAHTQVNFSAKHMMVTTVRGHLPRRRGDDRARRGRPHTLARRVPRRDRERRHELRRPVTRTCAPPTSSTPSGTRRSRSSSTAVESVRGNDYRVTGDLTIRDVTRARDVRRRARRDRPGHARRPPRGLLGHDEAPARRLGPELERRPRAGWLARRQGDQARDHGRGGSGRGAGSGRAGGGLAPSPSSRRPASGCGRADVELRSPAGAPPPAAAPRTRGTRRIRTRLGRVAWTRCRWLSLDGASTGWSGRHSIRGSDWHHRSMAECEEVRRTSS